MLALLGAGMLPQATTAQEPREIKSPVKPLSPACDRACLESFAKRYLAALAAHDPTMLPWAEGARFTENNVELDIGDGLWATNDAPASEVFIFADPKEGQVGVFGLVGESTTLDFYAMRMKVEHGKILEVETIVHRPSYGRPRGDPAKFKHEPGFMRDLTLEERRPRERMIDLANGYFATLQLNDGQLLTDFDPKCTRFENGLHQAGYDDASSEVFKLSCGEQFKLGYNRANTRVRGRDYMLVDEEKGLVLARGFIDHAGYNSRFELTDGEILDRPGSAPHTWCMLELFKIVDGKISKIEAVFFAVPYYMKTPWTKTAED